MTDLLPWIFVAIGVPLLLWGIRAVISLSREPWDEWDEMSREDDEDPKD